MAFMPEPLPEEHYMFISSNWQIQTIAIDSSTPTTRDEKEPGAGPHVSVLDEWFDEKTREQIVQECSGIENTAYDCYMQAYNQYLTKRDNDAYERYLETYNHFKEKRLEAHKRFVRDNYKHWQKRQSDAYERHLETRREIDKKGREAHERFVQEYDEKCRKKDDDAYERHVSTCHGTDEERGEAYKRYKQEHKLIYLERGDTLYDHHVGTCGGNAEERRESYKRYTQEYGANCQKKNLYERDLKKYHRDRDTRFKAHKRHVQDDYKYYCPRQHLQDDRIDEQVCCLGFIIYCVAADILIVLLVVILKRKMPYMHSPPYREARRSLPIGRNNKEQ
ncbi:hypothetical protein F5B18DRAFT_654834 [Nemania serpens]|nr:hypothetical protein F5B18DRAFT_654834 [Nemania serpens]